MSKKVILLEKPETVGLIHMPMTLLHPVVILAEVMEVVEETIAAVTKPMKVVATETQKILPIQLQTTTVAITITKRGQKRYLSKANFLKRLQIS